MVRNIIEEIQSLSDEQVDSYIVGRRKHLLETDTDHSVKFTRPGILSSNGMRYDTYLSDNCEIYLDGNGEYSYFLDDQEYICSLLIQRLRSQPCKNIAELSKIITEVIYDYFGGAKTKGTEKDRLAHLTRLDKLGDREVKDVNKLSLFKGTADAYCVEKATVAHQLFRFLGIDSSLVYTTTSVNDDLALHAISVVSSDNHSYIYDPTLVDHTSEETELDCLIDFESGDVDKLQNLPKRILRSQSGKVLVCSYNPDNSYILRLGKVPTNTPR